MTTRLAQRIAERILAHVSAEQYGSDDFAAGIISVRNRFRNGDFNDLLADAPVVSEEAKLHICARASYLEYLAGTEDSGMLPDQIKECRRVAAELRRLAGTK